MFMPMKHFQKYQYKDQEAINEFDDLKQASKLKRWVTCGPVYIFVFCLLLFNILTNLLTQLALFRYVLVYIAY